MTLQSSCWHFLLIFEGQWWLLMKWKGNKNLWYIVMLSWTYREKANAYGQVRVNAFIVLRRQSSCRGTTHPAPSLGWVIYTVKSSWKLGLEKAFFYLGEDLVVEFVLKSKFGKRFWSRSLHLVLKNDLTNIFCSSKYLIEQDTFAW